MNIHIRRRQWRLRKNRRAGRGQKTVVVPEVTPIDEDDQQLLSKRISERLYRTNKIVLQHRCKQSLLLCVYPTF